MGDPTRVQVRANLPRALSRLTESRNASPAGSREGSWVEGESAWTQAFKRHRADARRTCRVRFANSEGEASLAISAYGLNQEREHLVPVLW